MPRIAVVGLAGLLLSGVAMAATPQFYKGDTRRSAELDKCCSSIARVSSGAGRTTPYAR